MGFFGESRAQSTEEPVFIQPSYPKKHRFMHQSREVLQCLDQLLAIDPTHEGARQNRAVVLGAMQRQKGPADE